MINVESNQETQKKFSVIKKTHEIKPKTYKEKLYRSVNGTRESFKESWPTTSGVKLCSGFIERSFASDTAENSILEEFVIFSSSWYSETISPKHENGSFKDSLYDCLAA